MFTVHFPAFIAGGLFEQERGVKDGEEAGGRARHAGEAEKVRRGLEVRGKDEGGARVKEGRKEGKIPSKTIREGVPREGVRNDGQGCDRSRKRMIV